jgi:hypothetical protein
MKIRKRWFRYLLLLAFAIFGVRLAWTLTRPTTGWQPHLAQWGDVATSLVGIQTTPLSHKSPEEQAKFWLNEVSHVNSAADDPMVALGAACMLDVPQHGFIRRNVRLKEGRDYPGIALMLSSEHNIEAIRARIEDFESLCRSECLAKIDTATRLDSENVELWRARALLSFQTKYAGIVLEPRRENWLSVLDECAEQDPDNALYDYLAALHFWTSSAEHHYEDDGNVLTINDPAIFERGKARLAAGLAKPHLRCGEDGYAATMAFLSESSTARTDHPTAAWSREIDSRAVSLIFRLMQWQSVQRDVEKRKGNIDAAIAAVRHVLRISDQFTEAGNSPYLTPPKLILRQWSLARLKEMHEDHPHLVGADEAEKVSVELGQVDLHLKVGEEVGERLAAKAGLNYGQNPLSTFLGMINLPMLVFVAVGMALFSVIVAWVFRGANNEKRVEMGWLRYSVASPAGIGISFLLLGMIPAEIVSRSAQRGLLHGLIWVGFSMLVMGMLHLIRKWFQLPWTQLAVLAATTALPTVVVFHSAEIVEMGLTTFASSHLTVLILALFLIPWICWKSVRLILAFARNDALSRPRKLLACSLLLSLSVVTVQACTELAKVMSHQIVAKTWISPTVAMEAEDLHIGPSELRNELNLKGSKWVWAFIQWKVHYGEIAALLVAVGLLLVWHLIRQAHRVEGGFREILRSQKRSQIRQAATVVAKSCAVASLVFSLAYLVATPALADSMESYHQINYELLVNPSHARNELKGLRAQITSDESLMARFNAEIERRNQSIAAERRLFEE